MANSKLTGLTEAASLATTDEIYAVVGGNSRRASVQTLLKTEASLVTITGGTIDGTVIGGVTPAAVSGTTGQFGTSLNVDGTVTADGLSVNSGSTSSNISLRNSGTSFLNLYSDINGVTILDVDGNNTGSSPRFQIDVGDKQTFRITEGGDISFYATDGITQAFHWDAADESLGIGTSLPSTGLDVATTNYTYSGTTYDIYGILGLTSGGVRLGGDSSNADSVIGTTGTGNMQFVTYNGSAWGSRITLDNTGNVGIGTDLPSRALEVFGDVAGVITITSNSTDGISSLSFGDTADDNAGRVNYLNDTDAMLFYTATAERMRIDSSGGLILVGSTAQKATGTTWSNPSDQRLKTDIRDYTKGSAELMQVRVREWLYNGKGGTVDGMAGLGVIADEVMTVLPDTVETYEAFLEETDELPTAIKKFDATEITWLLVTSLQEALNKIEAMEVRLSALEAQEV
jgi:trimeric autotransporter adhesin